MLNVGGVQAPVNVADTVVGVLHAAVLEIRILYVPAVNPVNIFDDCGIPEGSN